MPEVVCDMGISVDGYVAGPNQREEEPLGDRGELLHRWMFEQPDENAEEIRKITDAGAHVMGRNMFGPVRGEWDREWGGWWGENPPYHAPVFVLTHFPHDPIPMEGGTTFYFVTEGIEAALKQAKEAAGDADVAIAGGASTVNQCLAIGGIDELRLHIAPVILGAGERLLEDVGGLDLTLVGSRSNELVTHVTYRVG